MGYLTTNVQAGDPDHPGLHNEERTALNAGAVYVVNPSGDGAVNRGNINAAIAEAIDANNYGATVILAPGTWYINDTIEIRDYAGLRILGSGFSTHIVWRGGASDPVFLIPHSRQIELAHMRIEASAAYPAYAAVQMLRDNLSSAWVPTKNHMHDVWIDGGVGGFQYGIVLGGTGSVDANNDFQYFSNVEVQQYTDAAWYLPGSQSYNIMMDNCHADGPGEHGVLTGGQLAGSFMWHGGSMSAHSVSDFYVGRSYQPFVIEFVNSEGSAALLVGATQFMKQIIIRGCRWAGNAAIDGDIIDIAAEYLQLALEYNSLGDGNNPMKAFTLGFSSANPALSNIRMIGNRLYSDAVSVFSDLTPDTLIGNLQITDETLGTTVALV